MINRTMLSAVAIAAAALACAACGRRTVTYRCEGGQNITARFSGTSARVKLPDTTVTLPLEHASTGDRYSDGTYTLWPNNPGTLMQRGDLIIYRNCITSG